MTTTERERLITLAREHAVGKGYALADVSMFLDHHDGSVVIHFDEPEHTDPTERHVYFNTPSTVMVVVDRNKGRCNMPYMI